MAGFGGLAGLSQVGSGYDAGAVDYWRRQNLETDAAGLAALGKAFMQPGPFAQPSGGAPGGSMGPGGLLAPQQFAPPQGPQMGGPPLPGGPPPMAGAPQPAGPPPTGMPGAQPIPGGPRFVPGFGSPGGAAPPGGAPPMSPQGQPGGAPPGPPQGMGGGAPSQMGGGPVPQQMGIEQLAARIRAANPNITPQVMASAISKALPLLNVESQQMWKQFQASTQYERLMQARERETDLQTYRQGLLGERKAGREERTREYDTSEARRREALDFRKDTKAKELADKAESLRLKATGQQASQDEKARKAALDRAKTAYNAYDKYMRSKIQAEQSLSGAEKKQALKELDAGWAEFHRGLETYDTQFPGAGATGQSGLTGPQFNNRFGGAPLAPGQAPAPSGQPGGVTGTGPNGEKWRVNPQTNQWEQVQ